MNRIAGIVVSGVISGVAYLGAQSVDLAITRNKVDDRVMLGRLVPTVRPSQARLVGTVVHLVNSIVFSAVFRLFARNLLAGPMWWRGTVFATLENGLLYTLALFEDFHPAIRDGQIDSYQSRTAFIQGVWRHIALGAVLGALTPEKDR